MELAQLTYVARHFLINVVNTLIHNFELSTDVIKIFHFSNWAGNSYLTAFSFQSLWPSRSCWSYGSRRPLKPLISFFTFSRFQVEVLPFIP